MKVQTGERAEPAPAHEVALAWPTRLEVASDSKPLMVIPPHKGTPQGAISEASTVGKSMEKAPLWRKRRVSTQMCCFVSCQGSRRVVQTLSNLISSSWMRS